MAKVYSNINQQMMNQRMNSLMMMNLNNRNDIHNSKYEYNVLMKDSTQLKVKSKMLSDTGSRKNYLLLVDKKYPKSDPKREQKIFPDQTVKITRTEEIGNGSKPFEINGIAKDSCWMFKVITGRINAYSYLSEVDMFFQPETICGIQLNDGPIVKLNADELTTMVGNKEDALKFIKKKNYYKAIKRYNKDFEKADTK
ncbi:hypothetical protein [Mucilaginibacter corticis]|nr:hypothetical protein [Mucilaginibacter corticis]